MERAQEETRDDTAHGNNFGVPYKVVDVEQAPAGVDPNDYLEVNEVHLAPNG